MTKIDLDDLERKVMLRTDCVAALIARIRELEAFVAAVPESALQAYKVHREDFPEMFAETGDTCMAMYMDTARAKLLERGAVLP